MTVTTLAEEEVKEEEVGRVGGWIASFDKLLEDPLGVVCLQVCHSNLGKGRNHCLDFVCKTHKQNIWNATHCLLRPPPSC